MEEMEAVYQIRAATTPRWIVRDYSSSQERVNLSTSGRTHLKKNTHKKKIILHQKKKTHFPSKVILFLYYWEYI